jgi:hypothetical protein
MLRKFILIPAFLVGTVLFLTASTASAHPPERWHHHPGSIIVRPIVTVPVPIITVPIIRPIPAPVVVVPVCPEFRVVYRPNCNAPWLTYNAYNSRAYAIDVAAGLQRQNFEVQVWTN